MSWLLLAGDKKFDDDIVCHGTVHRKRQKRAVLINIMYSLLIVWKREQLDVRIIFIDMALYRCHNSN